MCTLAILRRSETVPAYLIRKAKTLCDLEMISCTDAVVPPYRASSTGCRIVEGVCTSSYGRHPIVPGDSRGTRSWDRDPCGVLLTRDSRIDANARTVTALDARVYVCPVEPRMVRNEEYANYNPAGAVVYPAVNGKCDS